MANTTPGARDWSSGSFGSVANETADAGKDVAGKAKDIAGDAAARAKDMASDVAGKVSTAASSAGETISDAADRAMESDTFKAVEDFVRANPIPVLIGTAAAGAVIAMAFANRKSSRGSQRQIVNDMSRYTDDLRREMRSLINEDRLSKLINSVPTAEVSKAMSPWIAQLMEAMSAAKSQAKKTVADTAQTVHDKLS